MGAFSKRWTLSSAGRPLLSVERCFRVMWVAGAEVENPLRGIGFHRNIRFDPKMRINV